MHNLMSSNHLAGWKQTAETESHDEETDLIDDYYNFLIECDDTQQVCKSICKEILV